jgi:hypothetical protein
MARGLLPDMATRTLIVRIWLHKCGDREILWVMIGLFVLLVLGLNSFAGAGD